MAEKATCFAAIGLDNMLNWLLEIDAIIEISLKRPRIGSILLIDSTTICVLAIVFVATFFRSAFGFGEALVAVPLLALYLPLTVAAPLAVLLSVVVAGFVVIQDWQSVHMQSAGWLFLSTLLGIPIGLRLLTSNHQIGIKIVLALLIIAFSVFCLIGKNPPQIKGSGRMWLAGCGFVAGILGGAYGMNGPPLVVYGSMRRWSPQQFRATLQGYFLPASAIGLIGFWLAGLWIPAVTHYFLLSLPAAIPAIFLGRILNHRLRGDSYLRYVYGLLAAIGITLLVESLRAS